MSSAHDTLRCGRPFDFAVSCPVETALLAMIRRFVLGIAEEMGFNEEDRIKIEMAVDEACANVVRHAYPPAPDGHAPAPGLELRLALEPEALVIQIQDRGRGAAPEALHGAASLADYRRPGREDYHGLGLLIIHQFMDDVELRAHPGQGVTVTMVKRFSPAAPPVSREPAKP